MGKTLKRQRAREAAEAAGLRVPKRQKQGGAAAAAASAPSGAAGGGNLSFLVSQALQARDWGAAVAHLRAMRAARRAPKLGAVQRWVRDADAAGSEEVAARVICAVLRAAEAGDAAAGGSGAAGAAKAPPPLPPLPPPNGKGAARQPPVVRHPPWSPPPPPPPVTAAAAPAAATADTTSPAPALGQFYEIPRAPGAGGADSFVTGAPVKIFAYPPGSAVTFDASHPPPSRADVPFIPGAFVITGALSAVECGQMLAAGRALGFTRDVDYAFSAPAAASGGGGGGGGVANGQGAGRQGAGGQGSGGGGGGGGGGAGISAFDAAEAARGGGGASAARAVAAREAGMAPVAGRPAEGCVWMADASVLGPLYERVKKLLPQKLGGGALAGINPRWRLYRYTPGAVYRPHVDGAWPGSGLDAEGRYLFDAHKGEVWSRLTFLIYLNGRGEPCGGGGGGEEEDSGEGQERQAQEGAGGGGGGAVGGGEGARRSGGGSGEGAGGGGGEGSEDEDGGGFEGGATTFFTPSEVADGCLDARGVRPRAGNILVFPHGDTAGALVHEGSPVVAGAKYVVRTEVLYTRPPRGGSGRRPAPRAP